MTINRVSTLLFLLLFASPLIADEVKVDHVHLCCGKCVTGAKKSLVGVDGISKVRVNKTAETVVFEATNKESAHAGLKALAKSGFYGKPSIDGPKFGPKEDAKNDSVSVSELHLCCGGCINSAVKAIESVTGVSETNVEAKAGKIQVSGSGISLVAVMQALHDAGMHGDVK